MKKPQSYSAPGITVTFDPNLCIHSAVCLRALPAVFDVGRRRWVAPEAATVAEVTEAIDRCPSGALRYTLEGAAQPAESREDISPSTTILASRNGPLLVEGTFELLSEGGDVVPSAARVALCRCGGTGNQPFCDGTHKVIGFRSREPGQRG